MVSEKNIEVLTWVHSLGTGGIEVTLSRYLKLSKHRHTILTNVATHSTVDIIGANHLVMDVARVFRSIRAFHLFVMNRYDIFHSRFGYGSGIVSFLGHVFSRLVIVSVHSCGSTRLSRYSLLNYVMRLREIVNVYSTVLFAHSIIFHSKANKEYYFSLLPDFMKTRLDKKSSLIYNGVSIIRKSMCSVNLNAPGPIRLVSVGSLRRVKNHDLQLKICREFSHRGIDYTLDIYGFGENYNSLLDRINGDPRLVGRVKLMGHHENVGDLLGAYDVYLHTSISEGLGNAVIEAQVQGLPVFVSDISAMYESVYPGYHKYFFGLNEGISLIVDKFVVFCRNTSHVDIEMAWNYVYSNFSLERMVIELDVKYSNTMAKASL
jgi:glycosyltransferase involved in cell wall biosynthesis